MFSRRLPPNGQKWWGKKSTTQIPPKTPRTISNDASNIQENQVTMLTENIIKTFDIWNQITLDSIDISKENIKSIPKQ